MCIRDRSPDTGFLPDLARLEELAQGGVKLICLNNPNNPTGALMSQEMLEEIVAIARCHGAYILCDEVYRHLTQEEGYCPSIAVSYTHLDVYKRQRFRSRSMQALDARRYSQVEKLLSPWNEANPRQALRNASWAASWASSRSPVIRRHRV